MIEKLVHMIGAVKEEERVQLGNCFSFKRLGIIFLKMGGFWPTSSPHTNPPFKKNIFVKKKYI